MSLSYYKNAIKSITNHPLNKNRRILSIFNFLYWRFLGKLIGDELIYNWLGGAKFYFRRKEWGIVSNAFTGLLEFEEMSFLLHFLRDDDLFIDVGANHGSYTILASKVIGAKSISFEPVPIICEHLQRNVKLNHIGDKVKCINKAVGSESGVVKIKLNDTSSLNHIVHPDENENGAVEVEINRLDDELINENPTLMKIDVEGFEKPVLDGATKTLEAPGLNSVIIELNEYGNKYGFDENEIIQKLHHFGFKPYCYDPFQREISALTNKNQNSKNTIFIRNLSIVEERIQSAPFIGICGKEY
jgi:FkbM family methyltransferase